MAVGEGGKDGGQPEGQDLCPVREEGGQGRLFELPLCNEEDHRGDSHEVHYLRPGPVHRPAAQGDQVSHGSYFIPSS